MVNLPVGAEDVELVLVVGVVEDAPLVAARIGRAEDFVVDLLPDLGGKMEEEEDHGRSRWC